MRAKRRLTPGVLMSLYAIEDRCSHDDGPLAEGANQDPPAAMKSACSNACWDRSSTGSGYSAVSRLWATRSA